MAKVTKEQAIHEFMLVIGRYYAGKQPSVEASFDTVSHTNDRRFSSPSVITPAQALCSLIRAMQEALPPVTISDVIPELGGNVTLKSNTIFTQLVEQVEKNAEAHGWKFDVTFRTVAEDVLLDRIEKTAAQLGVGPETVLTSYLSGLQQFAEGLATQIFKTKAARDELYRETLPVEITSQDLGRAVASLGRVSWVMSFNEATLKQKAGRLEAVNINSAAADAISGLGLAIHKSAQDGPVESVTIDGEIVVKAREAIEGTIHKIQVGVWTCGSDDINAAVCAGMAEDLAPLLVNIPKD